MFTVDRVLLQGLAGLEEFANRERPPKDIAQRTDDDVVYEECISAAISYLLRTFSLLGDKGTRTSKSSGTKAAFLRKFCFPNVSLIQLGRRSTLLTRNFRKTTLRSSNRPLRRHDNY